MTKHGSQGVVCSVTCTQSAQLHARADLHTTIYLQLQHVSGNGSIVALASKSRWRRCAQQSGFQLIQCSSTTSMNPIGAPTYLARSPKNAAYRSRKTRLGGTRFTTMPQLMKSLRATDKDARVAICDGLVSAPMRWLQQLFNGSMEVWQFLQRL